MKPLVDIPGLGTFSKDSGMIPLKRSSDLRFAAGKNGVRSITATGDRKVEFIAFADYTLAYVVSAMNYSAYYPVHPVKLEKPVRAVLMDLDGTSVQSEEFWVWIIQLTVGSLLGNPRFALEEADLPYVSGHSVTEHLRYCMQKYCPGSELADARRLYLEHARREMREILMGNGRPDAFKPRPGLKEFLLAVKTAGIKIGLVTSGLYEKAWPEIVAAFNVMGMGDPREFYDAIISAGFPLRKGEPGTLGELSPKPHPWLYAETCAIGLGIDFAKRNTVLGIDDSGAGVCSIRIAGFPTAGIAGGNIIESGTRELCGYYCADFKEILAIIE
ncbi:MAG: HAD family hydrolase [Bacillota bacterium]